jgi:two-component system nitrogen regulation sensor histidine kinase GlnL
MKGPVELDKTVAMQRESAGLLACVELREIDQQRRLDREERQADLTQANKELIRNLAHEIKNPLGGVRGAAQLLDRELPSDDLREYTQVIIKEADRLQELVDQMLAPTRKARVVEPVNVHEVCERVRSLMLAEFPSGLKIRRDYDTSLPPVMGDREQLIQVVLNVVRNAAQALRGEGEIVLRTRVARQVTIAKRRNKLALDLHVVDNGPGIPEEIRDKVFYPLVSGHPQGHGLGLTLAQSYVQQHGGVMDVESRPGMTDFLIRLPIDTKWSHS